MSESIKYEDLTIENMLQFITQNDIKLTTLYKKYSESFDKYTDSRSLLFLYLHEINLTTILLYCNCAENYENIINKHWWIETIPYQKDIVNSEIDFNVFAKKRIKTSNKFLRDNYFLNIFFEFESKIRNIVRQLGNIPNLNNKTKSKYPFLSGDESWYFIVIGFFDVFILADKANIEAVHLYAAIRNTIHNGGFYFSTNNPVLHLNFMDQPFIFENLKPNSFVTIELFNNIYEKLIKLIDEVYSSPKIKSVKLIKDPISEVQF